MIEDSRSETAVPKNRTRSNPTRTTVIALVFINFSLSLGYGVVNPFFPLYLNRHGADGLSIGFFFCIYSLAKIVFGPIIGRLSDRWDRRVLLLSGLFLYSLISLFYLTSSHLSVLLLVRFLQGIGAATVRPIAMAFIAELAPRKQEGLMMATYDIAFYAALGVGPMIGGVVFDTWSAKGVFACLVCLCLGALLSGILFVRGNPVCSAAKRSGAVNCDIFVSSKFLALAVFIFGRAAGVAVLAAFAPLFLGLRCNFSGSRIGILIASTTLVTALLLRPTGRLSTRIDPRRLVMFGGTGCALLIFLIPLYREFWHMLLLFMGIGLFAAVSFPSSVVLLAREGERFGMGLTMGLFNSAMNMGFLFGMLLGGMILKIAGMSAVFYAAGLGGGLGTLVFGHYSRAGGPAKRFSNQSVVHAEPS